MLYDVVLLDPNMNALAPVTISTNEKWRGLPKEGEAYEKKV